MTNNYGQIDRAGLFNKPMQILIKLDVWSKDKVVDCYGLG